MKRKSTENIMVTLLALVFVLVLGSMAYAAGTIDGCPANYYEPEKGCQVTVDTEYVTEEAEAIDLAARAGCDANFYEPEKGCQVTTGEYNEEYALVGEVSEEEYARGCPANFFEAEKGCQLQNIR